MKKIAILLSLAIALFSCKKKSSDDPKPQTPIDSTTAVIRDNVHVIDSIKSVLNTDTALLQNGTYQFTGAASNNYAVGDIIVGQTGRGYLRKITAVNKSGSTTTYATTQAVMTDVIENGQLNFDFNTADLKTNSIRLNNAKLHPYSASGVAFSKASLSLTGNVTLDAGFGDSFINYSHHTLHYANVGFNNASLTGTLKLSITGAQGATVSGDDILYHAATKPKVFFIGALPVVAEMVFELHAIYSIKVEQSISKEVDFISTNTISAHIVYNGSGWSYPKSFSSKNDLDVPPFTSNASLGVDVAIVPEVSLVFYDFAGPYFDLGVYGNLNGKLDTKALDWDFEASAWLQGKIGARAFIFGVANEVGSITLKSEVIKYSTPVSMNKKLGDEQLGEVNKQLSKPIKVQVLDSRNKPQSHVPVYFEVTAGGGKVDKDKVITDADGYAQTSWTLGESLDTQKVAAKVKMGDGSLIKNTPLTFTAVPQTKIGDRAFGGVVFYIDQSGKHGLVCALEDQGKSIKWDPNVTYDNYANARSIGSTGSIIGTGAANTEKIVSILQKGNYAAYLCKMYQGGAYKDWYLPSKAELNEIFNQVSKLNITFGAEYNDAYWSSTELGNSNAYVLNLNNGYGVGNYPDYTGGKWYQFNVRAIRTF